jgi:predicted DNA-binding transcriptional regulator AlpA
MIMDGNHLPAEGYVRLRQIIGDREARLPAVIPVSRSTWWEGVRTGRFPKPVRLGKRVTAWRVSDIRKLLEAADADLREATP